MKIVLAALNAKYVHSNLAVYDLECYAKEQLKKELESRYIVAESHGNTEEMKQLRTGLPELVVREYTINHNLDSILQSLYQEKAEVVAFSCYIWNVHEILTIAKELHKVAQKTRIWLGGPEVSYDSKKLLEKHPYIEGIMRGEGEETFYELIKCWALLGGWIVDGWNWEDSNTEGLGDSDDEGCVYTDVEGITYRNHQDFICENTIRPLMNLSDVPFVYRDLSGFENKILYYETSRGCPFSCSYCLSSIDKSVRFRSMELVEKELQFFLDNKVQQVKFIDRTFNCKRAHSLAIWRYITEHDNGVTNFHFEVSADLIGEEELALFETMRPGLIQLEIGLQSTNPATIQEIRRSMNIEKLKENMLMIRSFENIHQHLDLIAGLPYEDFETFKRSFNDAYEMKPNQLQLGFLKVLKGSYMEEQIAEYELQYQDFQPYEVLSTKWLSYDEVLRLKLVEEMVEVYYNSDQFEHVLAYLIPLFESPYAFYEALGDYYEENNLFGIGFKREARYEVLRQFCVEWFDKCVEGVTADKIDNTGGKRKHQFSKDVFTSLLTYDYYLRENAKSRPSWASIEPIEKSQYHAFFKNGGTKEVRLDGEGYDSKVAARTMHIEPVVKEAVRWIVSDTGEELTDVFGEECECAYCLFDYDNRNSLTKDASVKLLSHL